MKPNADQRRLQRVIYLARMDGWSLVVLSSAAALVGLWRGPLQLALIGTGIALCGGFELRAVARLKRHDSRGLWVLPVVQLAVLALVLNYAAMRWHHADGAAVIAALPAFSREQLDLLLPERDAQAELLTLALRCIALAVGLGAILYQGALALWYRVSFPALRRALPPLEPSAIRDISG